MIGRLHGHEVELAVVLDADLLVGKFRNEFGDGVAEQEMAVLDQHHDADRDDRLGHREDAEDRVLRHRRGGRRALPAERIEPADLAVPRHHDGRAGDGSLVDLALEGVRHALQPWRRKPERFRLGLGKRRGLRGGGVPGGGLRGHFLSLCSCSIVGLSASLAQKNRVEQGIEPLRPCNPGRRLCLKRRGTAATQVSHRSVAQLVEHRSPKPGVAGSSPATPASRTCQSQAICQPKPLNLTVPVAVRRGGPQPSVPRTLTFGALRST